jgi:serine/threonine-protein kinase HipA
MRRCLFCYQTLTAQGADFHPSCSMKMFDQPVAPELYFSGKEIEALATEVIKSRTAVTGVQPKLSLHLPKASRTKEQRFTIVGLWGGYILKPPADIYLQLPEVEDLTMHLARMVNIQTAPHSLIRMSSGKLAYITKRTDRAGKGKLAMEDFCQLTERLTEDKYHGSHEQIAKALLKYSVTPGLDLVRFFELVLFSFITGNADMHLKNFSLLEQPGLGMTLSPAYDLVNTTLVNPDDNEELALPLNGKKRKIHLQDFIVAMSGFKITEKQQQNIFNKMVKGLPAWLEFIDMSFLSADFRQQYKEIILQRMQRLFFTTE